MANRYVIKDGKLVQTNPFCPRCGAGVFMADKGEWWACGKCGDRYCKSHLVYGNIASRSKGGNHAKKG